MTYLGMKLIGERGYNVMFAYRTMGPDGSGSDDHRSGNPSVFVRDAVIS